MQLHSFFNSSTSYRVRIALALKGVAYDTLPVNIRTLEHRTDDFVSLNPSASVPLLSDDGFTLGQSLAIIDYLDAQHPVPRLIPADQPARARVLELAYAIACDIHPVNNLRVLRYLQDELQLTGEQRQAWYRHWVADGLSMVERLLERLSGGPYCVGAEPSLADCCLVPQVANALRMDCDISKFERVMRIYSHCVQQEAFRKAAPESQVDYKA